MIYKQLRVGLPQRHCWGSYDKGLCEKGEKTKLSVSHPKLKEHCEKED